MGDNPLSSSFIMLPERLYDIFVHYILSGRTRAPPESDLVDMVPTFQFGAKTDRRALQSKFKSWAKRMNYEKGYLTLANSGKLIIPREKCDDLIMLMHSEEHYNIEKVITLIQMKYTWTKKNFGMDRDVVVECIARNCKRGSCLQKMRMELARLTNSLCPSAANSVTPEPRVTPESTFRLPSPVPFIPSYPFRWPLPFPVAPMFSPNGFPFRVAPFNNKYHMAFMNEYGTPFSLQRNIPENDNSSMVPDGEKDMGPTQESSSHGKMLSTCTSEEKLSNITFFKPKNVYEYELLMEAAKQNPEDFPEILRNEKTKFLSVLGIAPKSICSARTLKKFRKEHRRKKILNSECMVYRERKTLRDRNKLKKNSHEKTRSYFMQVLKYPTAAKVTLGKRNENKYEDGDRKKIKIYNPNRNKSIEVIDLASSDDETEKENNSPSNKFIKKGKQDLQTTGDKPLEFSGHDMPKLKNEERCNEQANNSMNKEEKHSETIKSENEDITNTVNETIQHNLTSSNSSSLTDLPTNILNPKPLSELNGVRHFSTNIKSLNASPHLAVKYIRGFPITRSHIGYQNTISNLGNNYLFSSINPVTVDLRQTTPSLIQSGRSFAVPNENSIPRNVYPVSVSRQVSNPSVFLVNRQPRGAFYVIPQLPRPALPQNFRKDEPSPATSASKSATAQNSVPSMTSEPQQQRTGNAIRLQTNVDGKTSKKDNKSKVDINEEISRISNWIYRMKANLNPNMFQQGIEKSVQKLIQQLNVGIYLVREARKSLMEIEKTTDFQKRDTEPDK